MRPICLAPACRARSQAKSVPTRASLGPYSVAAAARPESTPERERELLLVPPRAIIPEKGFDRENLLLRLQAAIQARASATFGGTSLEEGVETREAAPVRVLLLEEFLEEGRRVFILLLKEMFLIERFERFGLFSSCCGRAYLASSPRGNSEGNKRRKKTHQASIQARASAALLVVVVVVVEEEATTARERGRGAAAAVDLDCSNSFRMRVRVRRRVLRRVSRFFPILVQQARGGGGRQEGDKEGGSRRR